MSLVRCDQQRARLVDEATKWSDRTVGELLLHLQLDALGAFTPYTKWVVGSKSHVQRGTNTFRPAEHVKRACQRSTSVESWGSWQCELALKVSLIAWNPDAPQNRKRVQLWRDARNHYSHQQLGAQGGQHDEPVAHAAHAAVQGAGALALQHLQRQAAHWQAQLHNAQQAAAAQAQDHAQQLQAMHTQQAAAEAEREQLAAEVAQLRAALAQAALQKQISDTQLRDSQHALPEQQADLHAAVCNANAQRCNAEAGPAGAVLESLLAMRPAHQVRLVTASAAEVAAAVKALLMHGMSKTTTHWSDSAATQLPCHSVEL